MDGFEIQAKPTKASRPAKRAVPKYKPKLVRRKADPPPPPPGPVRVVLGVKHFINGNMYGPGIVEVPAHIANILHENEAHNAAEERNLTANKAAIIGRGNRKIPVDPSYFDNADALQHQPTL